MWRDAVERTIQGVQLESENLATGFWSRVDISVHPLANFDPMQETTAHIDAK